MLHSIRMSTIVATVALLQGCATERAVVSFDYVVTPKRSLPAGIKTLAIMPAKLGPTTDEKWSDMTVTILSALTNESKTEFGTDIRVTDRRDMQATFDEADLSAAGMSTRSGGANPRVLAADAMILSNINVKVEKHIGKQRTLSGLFVSGHGGHGYGGGSADIQTEQVDTVTRNMTVQTEFKLVNTANQEIIEHYAPRTFTNTAKTEASPIFGSSQTEAELDPQDAIIVALVERGAREFLSQFIKCKIHVEAEIESSGAEACQDGVRMLRGEMWEEALARFRNAMAEEDRDHQAAYGAGLASEAMGKYEQALKYYKLACTGESNPTYYAARDRLKTFGSRADG